MIFYSCDIYVPSIFSYKFGRNYSTPFCQTIKDNKCARNLFHNKIGNKIENNFTKNVHSRCKHSCTILQYSALEVRNVPKTMAGSKMESYDLREFKYVFGNADNKMNAFHEYLIYDSMGMIGSVGGTFGMFIGFSMTGVISSIIEFFKERKIGRNIMV